jgi:hypothetical protein
MKFTKLCLWLAHLVLSTTLFFAALPACAQSITVLGLPELSATVSANTVKISGEVTLSNKGDESAIDAYPVLNIERWKWAGSPRQIGPAKSQTWPVEAQFSIDKLKCQPNSSCADASLAIKGLYPVLLTRYYSDLNGYRFSAAGVTTLPIGDFSPEEHAIISDPAIQSVLVLESSSSGFSGTVEVLNVSGVKKKIRSRLHTSKELNVGGATKIIDLAGSGVSVEKVQGENFRGTPGSSYAIYAILEWTENGLRHCQYASSVATVAIETKSRWPLVGLIAGAVLVSLIALFLLLRATPEDEEDTE